MLKMLHIGKSFSGVRVLNDVEFDLNPGEVHILAGENGAGKTTLIRILGGAYPDYAGDILLNGQRVRLHSPKDAAANGISVIHQELSLVRSMSVMDNLFLGRERHTGPLLDRRAQVDEAAALLRRFDLDVDLRANVEDYPLSVQQMIEIAKALLSEARIFAMDEPTSALNDKETERLFRIVSQLTQSGYGIVYITHRMEEIYRVGDRITVLRDGERVGSAPARSLGSAELIRWMTGRDISRQFPKRATRPGRPAISVQDLRVPDPTGSRAWAVADVSFSVCAGEVLGVAGLQGSGRSDLLMGLFGAHGRQTRGRVALRGESVRVRSPREAMRHGLALLTNDRKETGLVPEMDITANIALASLRRFSPGGWIRPALEVEAARRHAAAFAIRFSSLKQDVRTLSGGNQQKVLLAKWIETGPKVLLLDEPTRGVDVGVKHDIYRLMNVWTEAGLALILATSELEELLAMSDRILVLHRGRIAAILTREQATRERVLRAAMGEMP